MGIGILHEAAKAKKAKRKDAPAYWRTVNGQHVGFDGNPPQGRPVIGSSKLTKYLMVPQDEEFEQDGELDIVEWGEATHYMKVKNPKTGNMNKIGFNDAGRAVSGDADLVKSINSKRRVKGADERDTIKALAPHNKRAERGGAPTSTNAYAISTKELGKAWKKRSKNWQHGTASDNAGFSWGSDNTPQQNRARDISIAADKAVDSLIDKKRKIKQLHGKKYRNPSMLDRLGRKLQSFFKPETLSDKDI